MLPEWATHRARGTMVIMLLLGVAFAIGHHFFYQSLSGSPPPSVVYFKGFPGGLTGKQINLVAGSAFAFLVHSALGAAMATAADQALWAAIRTKSLRLGIVDDLSTTKTNIWNLFDFRLWRKSLTSMLLAAIFWLLSIASFITPATLNVGWSVATSTSIARVPRLDFTSLNFADVLIPANTPSPQWVYSNPQYPVLQAVAGSTTGGHILPISPPHQNSTWLFEFCGPALSCENINKEFCLCSNLLARVRQLGRKPKGSKLMISLLLYSPSWEHCASLSAQPVIC